MRKKVYTLINPLIAILLLITLFACQSNRQQFEFAGGTFSTAIDHNPHTFEACNVGDIYSFQVLSQVMEGLVSFNPGDLSLQPQLALKWKMNGDGTVITFTLRDDVYFHEHEVFGSKADRLMTMEDVVYSFEKACSPNKDGLPTEAYLGLFANQLKGAQEFFEGKSKTISGLKVKGNDLELTLLHPDHNYINKLANINASILSKKVDSSDSDNKLIGTGPFCYFSAKDKVEDQYVLVKNQDYYLTDSKGNALPYLDTVIFYVQPRKLEQLEMFERGKIHLISELPTSRITNMLEGRISDFKTPPPLMILYNNPLLTTQYYYFNMEQERFKDVRVRKAFNYAIDRKRLADNVLRNQYYEYGVYGITPPIGSTFRGYDFSELKKYGYDYNPELARKLLAEAGYPGGSGFGTVNLRLDVKDINTAVAEEITAQIYETLGIIVNIDGSTFEQRIEDEAMGRGDMFRAAWIADFASPESFLGNFYGKVVPKDKSQPSHVNQSRYVNPDFDMYFESARKANRQTKYQNFLKAEIELMKNPPIIPLWYANDFTISYSKYRNLKNNPMKFLDLRQVYVKEWTKEEYLKSIR